MKKVYFLKSCDTCRKILKEVNIEGFEKQEIKTDPIKIDQLEQMHSYSNSYEALFNKRAKLYKDLKSKQPNLSEIDYKNHILKEYTFLKRPVFIVDNDIYIGNNRKVIEALKEKLN
ncbi:arsenate reductase family protein [Tenacibaculum sp. C7A-26P2]|uniref:arsenate reductase family protein n=1 Tax=Tenacibaculum sp. C7A-26P2 TaxID=3447504 RepID=UPI003F86F98C